MTLDHDLSVMAAPREGDAYAEAMLPAGIFGAVVYLCLRCGCLVGNRALHEPTHTRE